MMQGPVSPQCPHTCPHVPALTLFRSCMSGEKPVSMETSMMDMVASTLSRYLWGTGMRPPPCPSFLVSLFPAAPFPSPSLMSLLFPTSRMSPTSQMMSPSHPTWCRW